MQVTGIIAEYNPFHQGHRYQLQEIRQRYPDSRIIAVMSGSFTQRGEAALLSKWERASLAIQGGCDLVLELPFVFACRSAQDFARGGVALLQQLGIVDTLAFGAETNDLTALQACAAAIDDTAVQSQLHERIAAGASYAAALTACTAVHASVDETILQQPNNILAIEYLRSLRRKPASQIQPLLIQRHGAGYHEPHLSVQHASASAIRQCLRTAADRSTADADTTLAKLLTPTEQQQLKDAVPASTLTALQALPSASLPTMERLWLPLRTTLLQMDLPSLRAVYGIKEGLEHRILAQAATADGYADLIRAVTTKRYPSSRISRTLLYLLLQAAVADIASFDQSGPLYARILAASLTGGQLLRQIKVHGSIPLITKTSACLTTAKRREGLASLTPQERMLAYDTLATELRQLCQPRPDQRNDFQQSPRFLQQ